MQDDAQAHEKEFLTFRGNQILQWAKDHNVPQSSIIDIIRGLGDVDPQATEMAIYESVLGKPEDERRAALDAAKEILHGYEDVPTPDSDVAALEHIQGLPEGERQQALDNMVRLKHGDKSKDGWEPPTLTQTKSNEAALNALRFLDKLPVRIIDEKNWFLGSDEVSGEPATDEDYEAMAQQLFVSTTAAAKQGLSPGDMKRVIDNLTADAYNTLQQYGDYLDETDRGIVFNDTAAETLSEDKQLRDTLLAIKQSIQVNDFFESEPGKRYYNWVEESVNYAYQQGRNRWVKSQSQPETPTTQTQTTQPNTQSMQPGQEQVNRLQVGQRVMYDGEHYKVYFKHDDGRVSLTRVKPDGTDDVRQDWGQVHRTIDGSEIVKTQTTESTPTQPTEPTQPKETSEPTRPSGQFLPGLSENEQTVREVATVSEALAKRNWEVGDFVRYTGKKMLRMSYGVFGPPALMIRPNTIYRIKRIAVQHGVQGTGIELELVVNPKSFIKDLTPEEQTAHARQTKKYTFVLPLTAFNRFMLR